MKKTIFVFLLIFSSFSYGEWTQLSCSNTLKQSSIIEFDQSTQKVRIDGDNNKIFNSKITDLKIEWTTISGQLWNEIDRLTGVYKRPSVYPDDPPNQLCIPSKKKF